MAVDQPRHHLNFFRSEMLRSGNNNNANSNFIQIGNNLYGTSNLTTSLTGTGVFQANESLLLPYYNVNNVAGAGKLSPAVKDDSVVTFNTSLVPSAPVSRKRTRDSPVLTSPMISGDVLNSVMTVNPINSVNMKNSTGLSFLGEDFSLQFMQQQLEVDRLISQHMEKIKMEITERKKHQIRRTMSIIEESIAKKLREKEGEIEKISKINFALEEKIKSLHMENQIWRELAQTNEATANALRTNLEQVLEQVRAGKNVENDELADDAVSCCGSSGGNEEDKKKVVEEGKGWIYRGKNSTTSSSSNNTSGGEIGRRMCRKCGVGESRVLLLPCRHLCLCASCGPMVNICPICNSAKNASVHVNLS